MSIDFLKVNYDRRNRIWKSINYPYKEQTNCSVGEVFLRSMRSLDPNKVLEYHYDEKREKCVKDLYRESIIVAKNLQRLGMSKGDVVVLFSGYNYMTSSLTFGTLLMGGVVNFFELKLENEDIDTTLAIVQPSVILYEQMFLQKILKSLERSKPRTLKYIFAIDNSNCSNSITELLKTYQPIDFDQFQSVEIKEPNLEVAFLVLTSGSTGLPKVAQLTHCLLLNGVYVWWANSQNYAPINNKSILFSLSPLRWISQIVLLLQSALLGIKRICVRKAVSGVYGLEIIQKTKPSHVFSVPSFFHEVLLEVGNNNSDSLKSLKYIQLGGEFPSQAIKDLSKKCAINSKLFFSYGMSEVSCSITNDEHISGGKLQPGFEMQVLDDNLQPLGHNQYGKLAVKTPYPFAGYKGQNNNNDYVLENGFFLNGDFGYFDNDNSLHFLARLTDLVKCNKILLIPHVVETLLSNLPEVSTARLVGYRCSAKGPNQVAALFVILKEGVFTAHQDVASKIRNLLSAHLADDQILLIPDIYFRQSFPLNSCGKIDRVALQKLALQMVNLR